MDKLHLIMPMAGGGTRFSKEIPDIPKPLIKLQGKPFFYWAVQSVVKFIDVEDITFVVLQEHIDKYFIDKEIMSFFPKSKLVVIPSVLNGAVLTCLEAVKTIQDNKPILFNDCDHAFISDEFYRYICSGNFSVYDGALLTFKSDCPNYSYVVFDKEHHVSGTIEKEVASDEAICGAYYFRNVDIFSAAANLYLDNCKYSEFFISGVYGELVLNKANIGTFALDEHISFGTPDEYIDATNDRRLSLLQ